jgi:hypothetical protein
MALTLVGHETITSLSGANEAARKCSVFLQPAIDETLRSYNWNCATKRASLSQVSETPAFEFSYVYSLPSDCLRVVRMSDNGIRFKVEGVKLLCNEATAKILYIARITVPEMDPLLVGALAARIAGDLAYPMANSKTLAEAMIKLWQLRLAEAACTDAQEGTPDDPEVTTYLDARY